MYLTREEERMLNGEYGEAVSIAMRLLVRVGEALGAERLVPIAHAHVSGVSYDNIGDYGLEFIKTLAEKGARFRVYTTFNPAGVPLAPSETPLTEPHRLRRQAEIIRYLLAMGARYSATCIPYELRKPRIGEHLAWGESSAVAVANSLYGARTNREGGPLALAAAITGRTYLWGLHLEEERKPTLHVKVKGLDHVDELLAGLIGYAVADVDPASKPCITGVKLSRRNAISLCAAAAAHGSIAMCHIEGVTPEFGGCSGLERLELDLGELKRYAEEVACGEPSEAEVLFIGCPHYTLQDISSLGAGIAKALHSLPRVREVWIAVPALRWRRLTRMVRPLEARLGVPVKLLPGTCIVVTRKQLLPPVATNSVKTAIYLCKAGVPASLVSI